MHSDWLDLELLFIDILNLKCKFYFSPVLQDKSVIVQECLARVVGPLVCVSCDAAVLCRLVYLVIIMLSG